jgi:hypothetical protein
MAFRRLGKLRLLKQLVFIIPKDFLAVFPPLMEKLVVNSQKRAINRSRWKDRGEG